MRAKNRIKINRTSIPNWSKINQKSTQHWSKICQKSTPNRSKIAPWRGNRFFMIFGHMLGPLLDPFWTHFRPKNNLENISEITCKNISKKVRRWTFQVLFLGTIFTPNVNYFPKTFQTVIKYLIFILFGPVILFFVYSVARDPVTPHLMWEMFMRCRERISGNVGQTKKRDKRN